MLATAAKSHLGPSFPSRSAEQLRYELPLERAGEAAGGSREADLAADHRQGSLRVRVVEAEGLARRADGAPCEPYVTVAVAELLRRRTRRTSGAARGPVARWGEAFDFDSVSACAQVVVDVWDRPPGGVADLLGKAVLSLDECRPGVPHSYFKHLLEGKLVLRVLFDFESLPSEAQEEAEYAAQYAAAAR